MPSLSGAWGPGARRGGHLASFRGWVVFPENPPGVVSSSTTPAARADFDRGQVRRTPRHLYIFGKNFSIGIQCTR